MGGVTRNSWALSSELVSDLCYMIVTMKYLTAKQKAEELGITLSGLRKTRHLYKHIPKGPRKYLCFAEDPQDVVRPIKAIAPLGSPKSPRIRRRDVPFGEENYHKCPSGSGDKLKLYNQMRSKMAPEGTIPKEEQEAFKGALAYKVKENYKEIDEQRKAKIRSELLAEEERARKKDPSRYGGMIRGARNRIADVRTPWKNLFETPKTEYDEALENAEDTPGKKYYW